jgi:hypothetical protein
MYAMIETGFIGDKNTSAMTTSGIAIISMSTTAFPGG